MFKLHRNNTARDVKSADVSGDLYGKQVGFSTSLPLRARNIICCLLNCASSFYPLSTLLLCGVSDNPSRRPCQEG
ncbi:hypothetical protein C5167_022018 [Papaver somniferum]|uniref:Uncharacterized protein n=1 Tax=Papaver somniferum TaxID=3469 RepID=A0A4Y7JHN5_PAPSO|nr:hypothetical protein C5167_022018 [Papaver somniferum]